jgi:hypothetical protein
VDITVDGKGWTPGSTVTVQYFNAVGGGVGSMTTAVVDTRGRFTTTITAHDSQGLPGNHQVTAEDGTQAAQATYSASS